MSELVFDRFIVGLGTAAAWPLSARAQRQIRVVGVLGPGTTEASFANTPAFAQGLRKEGFVGGQNVAFESRYALGQPDRLPGLAADLVEQRVNCRP